MLEPNSIFRNFGDIFRLFLLLTYFLCSVSEYRHEGLCKGIDNCACMGTDNGVVDCNSRDSILGIPVNFDSSVYRNLVIQFVSFPTPAILKRDNVTSLYRLLRLKVVSCGLKGVESKAFVELRYLMELDLSLNELTTIEPDTFLNLNLELLRLDYNRRLALVEHSFRGLKTKRLSLRNCQLKMIAYTTLFHADFTTVDLFNNSIVRLDSKIAEIVKVTESERKFIDLTSNPLECSCDMLWLADLVRQHTQSSPSLSQVDISMMCANYRTMQNYSLALLRADDLNCNKSFIDEVMIDFTGMRISPHGDIQNTRIACSAVSSKRPNMSLGYFDDQTRQEISHAMKVRNSTSSMEHSGLVEASVTLSRKSQMYYCQVRDGEGQSKNEQEVKLLISLDVDTLLEASNGFSSPTTSMHPGSDVRFSALHLIYAVLITFLFTFLLTFIIWRVYNYWCKGCLPCHDSRKSSSSSSSSAYSTAKSPLSSTAAGLVPLNPTSHSETNFLPQHYLSNNNNTILNHKPLLSPTTSDYDIPQQFSVNNFSLCQSQLLYPTIGAGSTQPAPPLMGVSARKGNANTLGAYPHSRTLSTLRLAGPPTATTSGSPNTSLILGGAISSALPALPLHQQQPAAHQNGGVFIDYRTRQLCTPTPQLMSTSMSQPQALHSSLGYLS